ncbi:MAG: peptidase T [Pirellulaceae bacterium]|nr:peptidase T [Pirellulaceae bacterium]
MNQSPVSKHRQPIQRDRLLSRFLRYVRVGTPANAQTQQYPSSPGQWELGRILVSQLRQMGAQDIVHDEHGLVWATIPSTMTSDCPTILFNAHLDTSPEAPAENVRPQVIDSYQGGDIRLGSSGKSICVQDTPELQSQLGGHTLITTDGTTLLGGDDKAGVAAIMELAEHLLENPQLPHGPVRILFTCDEEIGRGADHVSIDMAQASVAYTLDAAGAYHVENATFSADMLEVIAVGRNIHPAIAKGKMVNAIRGLSLLLAELPADRLTPETTCDRQGFLHPYLMTGGVGEARAHILLRDFETSKLGDYADLVGTLAKEISSRIPGLQFTINRQQQYRNMAEGLRNCPLAVELAVQAHQRLGKQPCLSAIRGGTDGAHFTAMGLPTPNLSVGQHNVHSVLEFASLDEMSYAVEHAIELLAMWAECPVS